MNRFFSLFLGFLIASNFIVVEGKSLREVAVFDMNKDFSTAQEQIENVDLNKVRETWLEWNNKVRRDLKLKEYKYSDVLDNTAAKWSNFSRDRGYINHKRLGQKNYYDFKGMKKWFESEGVKFKTVGGSSFVENIGWGYFKCKDDECTDEMVKSVKTTFDFFIGEKNRKYRPHYLSIVNPNYKEIGLGIAIDKKTKKYFLTVHYGTEILSN